MALRKSDIVDSVKGQIGFSKKQSVEPFETLLEIMKKTLESGEDVLISKFGKFCVKDKRERRGRNPAKSFYAFLIEVVSYYPFGLRL